MKTITEILLDNRCNPDTPNQCLYRYNGQTISYDDLISLAVHYSVLFKSNALPERSLIAIVSRPSIDAVAAFIGAILGNFVPAFLSPPTTKQHDEIYWHTLSELIAKHSISVVVKPRELELRKDILSCAKSIDFDEGGRESIFKENVHIAHGRPSDIAFIQFSSGTTGLRKAIPVTHEKMHSQLDAFDRVFQFDDCDHLVSWLPLYHDMGLIACCLMPLLKRIPVTQLDPEAWSANPEQLLLEIEKHRCTRIFLPNFAFNHLAYSAEQGKKYDLSSVRSIVNCSEPCRKHSFELFLERFRECGITRENLLTCYAMAEAVFAVSLSVIPPDELPSTLLNLQEGDFLFPGDLTDFLSCGSVLENTEVKIISPEDEALSPGFVGEIVIRGDFVFSGYFVDHETSDQPEMWNTYFRTGDIGLIHNNELYILGRKKDVIIVNGKNLLAGEVEVIVSQVDGVKKGRVVATALPNQDKGTEDILLLVETTIDAENYPQLKRQVRKNVSNQFGIGCRVEVVPLKFLVKTSSGKLARHLNLQRYLEWRQKLQSGVSHSG